MDPSPELAPEEIAERDKLAALIDQHHGNISAIGRALNLSRQAITRHLKRYQLLARAENARFGARVPGPRADVDLASPERLGERAELVAALKAGGHRGAAKALGIGESTVARRMRKFGISLAEYRSK